MLASKANWVSTTIPLLDNVSQVYDNIMHAADSVTAEYLGDLGI